MKGEGRREGGREGGGGAGRRGGRRGDTGGVLQKQMYQTLHICLDTVFSSQETLNRQTCTHTPLGGWHFLPVVL